MDHLCFFFAQLLRPAGPLGGQSAFRRGAITQLVAAQRKRPRRSGRSGAIRETRGTEGDLQKIVRS